MNQTKMKTMKTYSILLTAILTLGLFSCELDDADIQREDPTDNLSFNASDRVSDQDDSDDIKANSGGHVEGNYK